MNLNVSDLQLENLGLLNFVLGKNGVGKSRLLRKIDQALGLDAAWLVKYVSPERGGQLKFSASVEQNIRSGSWESDTRRQNRVSDFRSMSFSEFRALEILVLRKREFDGGAPSFEEILDRINALLDKVKIVRGAKADPEIRSKESNEKQEAENLSSGETELFSLAIEILSFCNSASHQSNSEKQKLLLLDEPDVHLHPDLQCRLMALVASAAQAANVTVLIATHSTALLAGLDAVDARVAFASKVTSKLDFRKISEELKTVIPIFGAHPLSNVFNTLPVLLVEGDDDVRIWQQAVRSSQGRIKVWPCAVGDIQSLSKHEATASEIISAVYDNAKAYSLRDRDGGQYEIDDIDNVVRVRLFCRTAENLILSDEVLESVGFNWGSFKQAISNWLQNNTSHPQSKSLEQFARQFDRVNADVKDLRNLLIAIAATSKPWEVVVGQAIASLKTQSPNSEGSLTHMLGSKAVAAFNLRSAE